jgi:hypothetical protein
VGGHFRLKAEATEGKFRRERRKDVASAKRSAA